jgi:hypothetical protein
MDTWLKNKRYETPGLGQQVLLIGSVCAGDGQSRRPHDTGVRRGPSPVWVGVVPN